MSTVSFLTLRMLVVEAQKCVEAEARVDLLAGEIGRLEFVFCHETGDRGVNKTAVKELEQVQHKTEHLKKLYEELNKEAQSLGVATSAKEAENRTP